jgi:hypothetical protein
MGPAEIAELVSVLEEEIALGEELMRNLDIQKQAILNWDAAKLLESVDQRERRIKLLALLEDRRRKLLDAASSRAGETGNLRGIIGQIAQDDPKRLAVSQLRERTRQVFTRLTAEEGTLRKLMETLLGHIQDALVAFPQITGAMYDDSGLAHVSEDRFGLYQTKA